MGKVLSTQQQRQDCALVAAEADKSTPIILPRRIYELAGMGIPVSAASHVRVESAIGFIRTPRTR